MSTSDQSPKVAGGVVDALEAQAAEEAEHLAKTRRHRQQSQREVYWIEKLIEKHGDRISAMARDMKAAK